MDDKINRMSINLMIHKVNSKRGGGCQTFSFLSCRNIYCAQLQAFERLGRFLTFIT